MEWPGGLAGPSGDGEETILFGAQQIQGRLLQTSVCCDTSAVQHCHRGPFLSVLPSPPSSWLPFPLTLQKALRVQWSHFSG